MLKKNEVLGLITTGLLLALIICTTLVIYVEIGMIPLFAIVYFVIMDLVWICLLIAVLHFLCNYYKENSKVDD